MWKIVYHSFEFSADSIIVLRIKIKMAFFCRLSTVRKFNRYYRNISSDYSLPNNLFSTQFDHKYAQFP